jgi:hypothetical protein
MSDPRSVKIDMGQGPPSAPSRRPEARTGSGAAILTSALLALLCGGAGAWAYERFLAPMGAGEPKESASTPGRETNAPGDLARLNDRVKILSDQCDSLSKQNKGFQQRLDSLSKNAASPDTTPIEEKLARVGQLSQQVEAIGKQVGPLHEQVAQYDKKVTDLDAKLDELRREVTSSNETTPSRRNSETRTTSTARRRTEERAARSSTEADSGDTSTDPDFESAISQFRDKRYSEAYSVFRRLLQSRPDDARLWYYAAIAYGLASNDWGRMAQSMAEEGLTHEKAGHPQKSAIDAAFSGLTKETGKDWLAYYRQRAQ